MEFITLMVFSSYIGKLFPELWCTCTYFHGLLEHLKGCSHYSVNGFAHTCAFAALTSQNVCCEKDLL